MGRWREAPEGQVRQLLPIHGEVARSGGGACQTTPPHSWGGGAEGAGGACQTTPPHSGGGGAEGAGGACQTTPPHSGGGGAEGAGGACQTSEDVSHVGRHCIPLVPTP